MCLRWKDPLCVLIQFNSYDFVMSQGAIIPQSNQFDASSFVGPSKHVEVPTKLKSKISAAGCKHRAKSIPQFIHLGCKAAPLQSWVESEDVRTEPGLRVYGNNDSSGQRRADRSRVATCLLTRSAAVYSAAATPPPVEGQKQQVTKYFISLVKHAFPRPPQKRNRSV